ncbi:MAG: hypothetical protein ACOC9J_01200 [Persicimonas sp.]
MSSSKPIHWSLYVDESGDFDADPPSHVVLTAVAVPRRSDRDPHFEPRLREALIEAAPLVPWPPHAWLIFRPAMYVIWSHANEESRPKNQEYMDRALDAFQQDDAQRNRYETALASWKSGSEPAEAALKELESYLRATSRATFEYFSSLKDTTVARLRRVLEFAWLDDLSVDDPEPLGFVVSETDLGDAQPKSGEDGDRYATLMVSLLERVRDTLFKAGGSHSLDVYADRRKMRTPNMPMSQATELHRPHLEWITSQVHQTAPSEDMPSVRFGFGGSFRHKFNDDVPPGIVLADFAAITLRNITNSNSTGSRIDELNYVVTTASNLLRVRFDTLTPDAQLPHVSATGRARKFVNRARHAYRHGEAFDERLTEDPPGRRWVRQQANIWSEHVE